MPSGKGRWPHPHHPMQEIVLCAGRPRFRANKIVEFLLEWCQQRGMGLNELAVMAFTDDDRTQFAQLIGYSVDGFFELSYTNPEQRAKADRIAAKLDKTRRRSVAPQRRRS